MNDKVAIYVTEDPRYQDAGSVVSAYRSLSELRRAIETGRPEDLLERSIEEVLLEALDAFRFETILTKDFPQGGGWRSREAFQEALSRASR